MKENKKQYWKGVEQLTNHPEFVKYAGKEFPQDLPYKGGVLQEEEGGSSRRDFLKLMGFSVAAASLAACDAPVRK
ncbi:MAG: TAT-variant-translocated molybdopterin oxidoreductase, partial [Cyclobacteriaceae bacterium]|nr:TAT-variant-translocated molybdopterin oxidoreductase [Cyclobacteriaceae bacterium]